MTSVHADSTPRRPRAATTMLPAIASPSPHQMPASPPLGPNENGPGSAAPEPLRHPKPLTPSDLHLVLEKEQESMVNRLTRELSLLRQQTASVASTASSTSTFDQAADGPLGSPTFGSSAHSHISRRQRSSSSLSSQNASIQHPSAGSVSGIAPSRTADASRTARSREASLTHRRPSISSLSSYSQHPHPEQLPHHHAPSIYPHRNSVSQTHLGLSSNSIARYEEVALHKSELELARRENEPLRRRVRELEHVLKKQKEESVEPVETEAE